MSKHTTIPTDTTTIPALVEDLSCDHILSHPIPYDWTAWHGDDSEERPWSSAEVVACPNCTRFVVAVDGVIEEHNVDAGDGDCETCDGSNEPCQEAEGPMMSYWYPCTFPDDMIEAARALGINTVCAVTVDGKEGLALTGGGMDLSWEICAAFVTMGCLPPMHFASDLPMMGGIRLDPGNLLTLAAAQRSCEVAASWATRGAARVAELRLKISAIGWGKANMLGVPDDEIALAEMIASGGRENLDEDRVLYLMSYATEGK
jgi:hypothetical protein